MKSLKKDELRNLLYSIMKEELESNGLKDYKIFLPTDFEVLKDTRGGLKNKIISYRKSKEINGFQGNTKDFRGILIYIDHFLKFDNLEQQLFESIFAAYHEVRHAIQSEFDINSYDRFINDMSEYYKIHVDAEEREYMDNHDYFSFEVGADLFAINKTRKYIKDHFPDIYDKMQYVFEYKEEIIRYYYMTSNYVQLINKSLEKMLDEKIFDEVPIINRFIDKDGNFKSIGEIKHIVEEEKIDKRIAYYILGSMAFKKRFKKIPLSDEEKKFLRDGLSYVIHVCENQNKYAEKFKKNNEGIEKPKQI